jgi:imidazoleglycerol phosphate dehydratase HisB
MSGVLDLTTDKSRSVELERALKSQLAAICGVSAGTLILTSTPDDARRALNDTAFDDLTGLGVLGLDRVDVSTLSLVQLGSSSAPICVLVSESELPDSVEAALSVPPIALLQAGLDAIRPAARRWAQIEFQQLNVKCADLIETLTEISEFERVERNPAGILLIGGQQSDVDALGLSLDGDGSDWTIPLPDLETAKSLAKHLGAQSSRRIANLRRSTKETDITLSVDLDGEGAEVDTGVHFFDHMLDQIARHGGIGLNVVCDGDVEVDAHHTIEDVCLALGDGLREALGDKRGISRFGFETPMDETRSSVWIDLSGRPFCKFEGKISGERVGDFPVEMCEHAFRSISETLKAAIHVKVEGDNAHHMIESCFKSFGRALRMASRIEGDALPSTKGVL